MSEEMISLINSNIWDSMELEITSHFGKKPNKGGKPPIDSIIAKRESCCIFDLRDITFKIDEIFIGLI